MCRKAAFDQNRKGVGTGKIPFDRKQERHWKPALGAGDWVCQDPWELSDRRLDGRRTGSEADGGNSGTDDMLTAY